MLANVTCVAPAWQSSAISERLAIVMIADIPSPCPFDFDKSSVLAEYHCPIDLSQLRHLERRLLFDATASIRGTVLNCKKQAREHHSLSGSSSCYLLRLGRLK